ncbi:hypothetical protein [Streptomyces caelestis]|uniref:hypothetical protein n=1 Tax=Streptomyces caelestis TaxID=36816 RepID=UPI00364A3F65
MLYVGIAFHPALDTGAEALTGGGRGQSAAVGAARVLSLRPDGSRFPALAAADRL